MFRHLLCVNGILSTGSADSRTRKKEGDRVDRPVRKPIRLKNYDYSAPGAYFITICTREKRCILSSIQKPSAGGVGDGAPAVPRVRLTSVGQIVDKTITDAQAHYGWLSVDRYVIMPNHVHLLITVKAGGTPRAASPTKAAVPAFVSSLKSITVRRCGVPLWQRSFYDHIVRNEAEYREIAEYIDANPARWKSGTLPPGAE